MDAKDVDFQLEYWNINGPTKTFNHPVNFEQLDELLSRDAKVLDYGCGYGRVSHSLHEHGYTHVRGVDFSVNMVDKGHRLYPHLTLEVIEALPLPFENAEFDAVLLFTVLTCIPSNQAQIHLMQELCRILRDGGILYISDLCLQGDARNLKRYQNFQDKYGIYGIFELPEGAVVRHHDWPWIKTLTADFKQIVLQAFEVMTMNNHAARGFQLFARKEPAIK